MESQLQHTHGRHFDESDKLTTGLDQNEDEHHGEKKSVFSHNEDEHHGDKKSVIKKVKDKAKKIKSTIKKHGHVHIHGHGHGQHHYDNVNIVDHDDESVEDPEIHGAPMYDSIRVDQMGIGHEQEKLKGKIGKSSGMEVASPMGTAVKVGGGLKDVIGEGTRMAPDPQAPKDPSSLCSDPSNYATKVTNPTHTGGKEAELSQLLDKMAITSEPKTLDHNRPENLPRETLTGNPHSNTSTYVNKISSSASAIVHKAAATKDVIAHKLGYPTTKPHQSGKQPVHKSTKSQEFVKHQGSATDYAHKITGKVAGTLVPVYEQVVHPVYEQVVHPVYEQVVHAGSSVISKVHGTYSGTGHRKVRTGGSKNVMTDKRLPVKPGAGDKALATDKGVSVKEKLVETLRPGADDKALSDVITNALHLGQSGQSNESEKKSKEDKPMGIVTESAEVRRRLGTDKHEEHKGPGNVVADKGVTERLSTAMGTWFGGQGDAAHGTTGTTYVTDKGLSSNPTGDQNKESGSK